MNWLLSAKKSITYITSSGIKTLSEDMLDVSQDDIELTYRINTERPDKDSPYSGPYIEKLNVSIDEEKFAKGFKAFLSDDIGDDSNLRYYYQTKILHVSVDMHVDETVSRYTDEKLTGNITIYFDYDFDTETVRKVDYDWNLNIRR